MQGIAGYSRTENFHRIRVLNSPQPQTSAGFRSEKRKAGFDPLRQALKHITVEHHDLKGGIEHQERPPRQASFQNAPPCNQCLGYSKVSRITLLELPHPTSINRLSFK
jgi:hypothetical protein